MRNPRLLVVILAWMAFAATASRAGIVPVVDDPGSAFFASPQVVKIRIQVDEKSLEKLRAEPRSYVKAEIREEGRITYSNVAIKLKGAAGSFRDWDDRPALTLNMKKFKKGGDFHGMVKFHLNNSVQDETYLNELLCSELFRKAGVPAPRVTHARVWLNGRDVGLYVLKEGFDKPFLKRSFADPTGNLYDGGFLQDLDGELERDEGSGPDDRSDLRAIVEAASDPDPAARRVRIETLLDMDAFFTFMAMERMTCHWDGYANNANNYRLYFDPRKHKAVFLPHGMDQMFGEVEMGLFDPSEKLITAIVLQNDVFRKKYRKRLEELMPLMVPADPLIHRADEVARKLRPVLEEMGAEQAAQHAERVAALKNQIAVRSVNLRKQMDEPEESTQEFDADGSVKLEGWWNESESENAVRDEVEIAPEKRALHLHAADGEPCIASWRRHVLLPPGIYTLSADVRAEGVVKLDETDDTGVGVGISGVMREQHLHGTVARRTLRYRFEVKEDRKLVLLVLELRAKSGQVWFDADSLKLIRGDK